MCLARVFLSSIYVQLYVDMAGVFIILSSFIQLLQSSNFLFAMGLLPVLHVMSRIGYHYGRIRFIEIRASRTLSLPGDTAPQKGESDALANHRGEIRQRRKRDSDETGL